MPQPPIHHSQDCCTCHRSRTPPGPPPGLQAWQLCLRPLMLYPMQPARLNYNHAYASAHAGSFIYHCSSDFHFRCMGVCTLEGNKRPCNRQNVPVWRGRIISNRALHMRLAINRASRDHGLCRIHEYRLARVSIHDSAMSCFASLTVSCKSVWADHADATPQHHMTHRHTKGCLLTPDGACNYETL